MATIALQRPVIRSHVDCDHFGLRHGPEAAAQAFVENDLVARVSGEVAECAANDPALIAGLATASATGTTGDKVTYKKIEQDMEVEMSLYDFTNTLDYVVSQADMGSRIGVAKVVAGGPLGTFTGFVADAGETTAVRLVVERLASGSKIGDTNARVLCRFVDEFLDHGGLGA